MPPTKSHTAPTALLRPLSRPLMMDLPALTRRLPRLPRALTILPGRPLTKLITARMPLLTAFFIAFQALVVMLLARFQAFRRKLATADTTLETTFLIPFHTLEAVFLIPFHIEDATDLIQFHVFTRKFLMWSQFWMMMGTSVRIAVAIAPNGLVMKATLMALKPFTTNGTTAFHALKPITTAPIPTASGE